MMGPDSVELDVQLGATRRAIVEVDVPKLHMAVVGNVRHVSVSPQAHESSATTTVLEAKAKDADPVVPAV